MSDAVATGSPSRLGRAAGLLIVTVVIVGALLGLARVFLWNERNPEANAEQVVFEELVVIPEGVEVLLEPAWDGTYYGSLLVPAGLADQLVPGGVYAEGDPADPTRPAFSYQRYTTEGEWTCLAYADLHTPDYPSVVYPAHQLDGALRAAYEAGESFVANIGTICGTAEQFPGRSGG